MCSSPKFVKVRSNCFKTIYKKYHATLLKAFIYFATCSSMWFVKSPVGLGGWCDVVRFCFLGRQERPDGPAPCCWQWRHCACAGALEETGRWRQPAVFQRPHPADHCLGQGSHKCGTTSAGRRCPVRWWWFWRRRRRWWCFWRWRQRGRRMGTVWIRNIKWLDLAELTSLLPTTPPLNHCVYHGEV